MEQQVPRLTVAFRDASGAVGLLNVWAGGAGLSVPAIESGAAALRSLLIPLSDATVVGQSILFRGVESPRPTAPGPSIIGDAGLFIFDAVGGEYNYLSVPALRADLLEMAGCGAGVRINLAHPDVQALSGALQILFCNPFGATILPIRAAMLQRLWRGR